MATTLVHSCSVPRIGKLWTCKDTHTVMRGALISLVEKPLKCGVVTIKSSRDRLAFGYKVHTRPHTRYVWQAQCSSSKQGQGTWYMGAQTVDAQWILQQCLPVTHSESTLARGLPLFFLFFFFPRPTNQTASCTATGVLLLLLFNGQLGAGGSASDAGSSARLPSAGLAHTTAWD